MFDFTPDREHTLRQPTTERYLLAFHGMMINAAFPPPPPPSHANPSFHSTLLPFSLRVIYAFPSVRPHISGGGKERKERVSGGYRVSKPTLGVTKKEASVHTLPRDAPWLLGKYSEYYVRPLCCVLRSLHKGSFLLLGSRESGRESVGGVAFREILGQD